MSCRKRTRSNTLVAAAIATAGALAAIACTIEPMALRQAIDSQVLKPKIGVSSADGALGSGAALDFGSVAIGTAGAERPLVISNTGGGALVIPSGSDGIALSGADVSEFSIKSAPSSLTVSKGGTVGMTLLFAPVSIGTKSAVLTIKSNDPELASYTINLTGTGNEGAIVVKQGDTEIPAGTGSYAFSSLLPGATGSAVVFTIENAGSAPVSLTDAGKVILQGTDSSQFVLSTDTTTATIEPGGSTVFSIAFAPTTGGQKTASVAIPYTAPVSATYTFSITGLAVQSTGAKVAYEDGGSWHAFPDPPSSTIDIAVASGVLYALGSDGAVQYYDGGWQSLGHAAPAGTLSLTSMGATLYALTSGGAISYLEGGIWHLLPAAAPSGASAIAGDGSTLYLLANSTELYSLDGATWKKLGDAPAAVSITVWNGSLAALSATGEVLVLDGSWKSQTQAPTGCIQIDAGGGALLYSLAL